MSSSEISSSTADGLLALLQGLKQAQYHFITVTPSTHASINQRPASAWAHNLRDVLGWSRPFTAATLPEPWFNLLQQAGALQAHVTEGQVAQEQGEPEKLDPQQQTLHQLVSNPLESQAQTWRSLWRVSSLGDVLMLHSAFPTLAADAIFFGPDTYRFARAVTQYLDTHQSKVTKAVDIGTGSGAAAILLALRYPQASVSGVDINPRALSVAAINGRASGADNLRWQQSNLLQDVAGNFDLIVANPPYLVDDAARTYRHGGGLLGAELSLKIVEAALPRLETGGVLLLYTGVAVVEGVDVFLQALQAMLAPQAAAFGVEYEEIDPDIFAEELQRPAYVEAERIAAVLLSVRRL
ncbi:MAG: class I SAM-dependent methyltransferase [Methylobacillus glycogenes]|nr:class I SAM-dependent methyltransferase [Methylobacillus glycogenes]